MGRNKRTFFFFQKQRLHALSLALEIRYKIEGHCSICTEALSSLTDWINTCENNHGFHFECITMWVRQRKENCPLCRGSIKNIEGNKVAIRQNEFARCVQFINSLKKIDKSFKLWLIRKKKIMIVIHLKLYFKLTTIYHIT